MQRSWRTVVVGLALVGAILGLSPVAMAQECPADILTDPNVFIHPKCPLDTNILNVYVKSVSVSFLIAFITLVWVGYIYITSLGNAERVNKAKDLLGKVVVGIIILLLIPLILIAIAPPGP